MKIKWIVITRSTQDKEYHCFDRVYDTKKDAQEAINSSKQNETVSYLHNWKKTKIVPINWGSLENRSSKQG